jgi:(1->4)-alpha-D-glucan 1-alpha-D-glucosylmutase
MIPRATYRIQFGTHFGFADAAAIAPYLAQLGISHVYTSPYLQARPDSKHGYDITDHNALSHELGGDSAFKDMVRAFRTNGLEHILDYVPNHMGVGGSDNPYWLDVLEWGQDSPYAGWFDIDWDSHSEYLSGKLLVPFLADQYGAVLESGQVQLKFDDRSGEFSVWLYDTHKLPVTPPSYRRILGTETLELERLADEFGSVRSSRAEMRSAAAQLKNRLAEYVAENEQARTALESALRRFKGKEGQLDSWAALDSLVRDQHWRPTHFRVAADDINYRRFFNISDLAGIRMELPAVFLHTHQIVLRLLLDGSLQGLRIDHIDGLYNPKEYLARLRASGGPSLFLIVEKILAARENLRDDWTVDGTTGYEFCSQVTGLLVNSAAERPLTNFYYEFTGETQSFSQIVRESKIKIMENEMGSELESLARDAVRIARQNPRTTDFTQNILRRAIEETIACFPVYRTYVDGSQKSQEDQRYIHSAIVQATRNEQELDKSVFDFLERALTGELTEHSGSGFSRHSVIQFAMRAQQFSGPVMAKGLEDTAFYRYNRFIALNEVGSSPDRFGTPLAAFHKENQHRAERWPHTMLATSTHDVKRGEDARARLAALSLIPDEWIFKVLSWNRIVQSNGNGSPTPALTRNDEYLFFQNLIATWPADLTLPCTLDPDRVAQYSERVQMAMIKSVREARVHSNWISPDTQYEGAVTEFVRKALDPDRSKAFFDDFLPFQQRIAELGVRNSLVQVLLKVTSPGLPDFYQGSDLWDLNLPDPDNRRPIDFAERQNLLNNLSSEAPADPAESLTCNLQNWHNGAIKLSVINELLKFRRHHSNLFAQGSYQPVPQQNESDHHLCAFFRTAGSDRCLVVALLDARLGPSDFEKQKLLLAGRDVLPGGTDIPVCALEVPIAPRSVAAWRDIFTQRTFSLTDNALDLSAVLSTLPIALLAPTIN